MKQSTQPSYDIAHSEGGSQRSAQHGTVDVICHYLINPIKDNQTKLVITEKKPTLVQVWNNFSPQIEYLRTNYEEADVIIVYHLVRIASEASDDSYIKIVCNDTDVVVLLIHFYLEK